ncbi:MAG: ABC transporter substrate-binding protein [Lawsonibacter sp.]|nr:ABC transporter substrate-binding protein [Lawsonibacter sp.]
MKRYRLSTLFLALLLTLTACAVETVPDSSGASSADASQTEVQLPETVPFTLAFYPEFSLHPALAGSRANLTLAPLLYEGLFAVDASFQATSVLCQSYAVSEDKLSWTFTLRPGITFSDGTPLTGQTVADALNLARSPQGRYQERLAGVTAAVSSEEAPNQVTLTLLRPNGSLPLLLDIPIALGDGERPLGTGPYVLFGAGEEASLTARDGWWQSGSRELPVQSIPLHAVYKSDDLIYAFDTGEVSLVDVDLMATNAMGYGGNYQTWDYATTDFLYLGFNTQTGVFRAADARRAAGLAVDREAIASSVYANHAISTLLPVHPSGGLYQPGEAPLTYNPEALARQMEELRLENSQLVFLVNSENTAKASAARLIAYQLEAAGFLVDLRQLPFEDYTAALAVGEFDLYLGETVLTADFDLAPLLGSTGALNYGRWWAETADGLLWAMHAAAQEDKAAAARALFALLDEQAPIVPIAFKNGSVLTQWGRLSGLSPVRSNVFYQMENWSIK